VYSFNSSLEPESFSEYILSYNGSVESYETVNEEHHYIKLNGENQYLTLSNIDFDIKSFGLGFYLSNVNTDNYLLRFNEDFYIKVNNNDLDIQINAETLCNINNPFSANTWHSIFFNYNDVNMYDIYIDDVIQTTTIPYDPFIGKELIIGKYTESNVADVEIISKTTLEEGNEIIISNRGIEINSEMYIFGGSIYASYIKNGVNIQAIYLNDLSKIDTEGNYTKIELHPIDGNYSNIPPVRREHSMVEIQNNIYIFGGKNQYIEGRVNNDGEPINFYDTVYLKDFYKIDIVGNSTKIELTSIGDDSNIPPKTINHSMVAIESNIYIFGGENQTPYTYLLSNKLYKIDTTTFVSTKIELQSIDGNDSNIPSVRLGHSMVAIESNIYIFGGYNNINKLNDLYKIDTTTNKSIKIELVPDNKLTPRFNHYMTVIDNYMYIVGGNTDSVEPKQIYKIDTDGNLKQIKYDNTDELLTDGNFITVNNNIYKFSMFCSTANNEVTSTALQKLIKITPTIRDHHLNGNIAKLRINNVITNDSEIISNYSNLNCYYNL